MNKNDYEELEKVSKDLDYLIDLDHTISHYLYNKNQGRELPKLPSGIDIDRLTEIAYDELRLPILLDYLKKYYALIFEFRNPKVDISAEKKGGSLFTPWGRDVKISITIMDRKYPSELVKSLKSKCCRPSETSAIFFDHVGFNESDFSELKKVLSIEEYNKFIEIYENDPIALAKKRLEKKHPLSDDFLFKKESAKFEFSLYTRSSIYHKWKQLQLLCKIGQLPSWFLFLGATLPLNTNRNISLHMMREYVNSRDPIVDNAGKPFSHDSLSSVASGIRRTKNYSFREHFIKVISENSHDATKQDKKFVTWLDFIIASEWIEHEYNGVFENNPKLEKFINLNKNIYIFSLPMLLRNFKKAIPKDFNSGREEYNKRIHPILSILRFKHTPMFGVHLITAIRAMKYNYRITGVQDPSVKLLFDYTTDPTQKFGSKVVVSLTPKENEIISSYINNLLNHNSPISDPDCDKALSIFLLSLMNIVNKCPRYLSENDQKVVNNISDQLDLHINEIYDVTKKLNNGKFSNTAFMKSHETYYSSTENLPDWPNL